MKYGFPLYLLFASLLALTATPLTYSAQVLEVYPTGVYPNDATNVQAALGSVDSPGTVVLKSTDTSGNPLAFNFGAPNATTGTAIKLLRPDVTLTGDGWDEALNEPKTKIIGGGGPYSFSPTVGGVGMVFAIHAPGVRIRQLKLTTTAFTGVYISSANLEASDHSVIVEENDFSALVYPVLSSFTAGFPVKINNNVFRGLYPLMAQWIGFTLSPIGSSPYDEPIEPLDSWGNVVRFSFEITGNRILKTPGPTGWQTIVIYGWDTNNSQNPDPEIACRRFGSPGAYVYQYVRGDNGPVLISGNSFEMASPGGESISLGTTTAFLNHAVVKGNMVSGECQLPLAMAGRDHLVMDNDFSRASSSMPIFISAADSTFSGNILGSLRVPGVPAVTLYSAKTPTAPMPDPVENCVIMKNDYRRIGSGRPAVVLASEADLKAGSGIGNEVKNNLIFESGRFPEGTGGAQNWIQILTGEINPETDLPYVHDNRIVGQPATEIHDPGIGWIVSHVTHMIQGEGTGN